jgi:hypothetical protein
MVCFIFVVFGGFVGDYGGVRGEAGGGAAEDVEGHYAFYEEAGVMVWLVLSEVPFSSSSLVRWRGWRGSLRVDHGRSIYSRCFSGFVCPVV